MLPVLFTVGRFEVYTYGVLIALGGAVSCAFWSWKRRAMGLARDEDLWLLVNVILLSGFVGGRILFLVEYVRPGPGFWSAAFALNKGFSVLGAFAGVILGVFAFCRRKGVSFPRVLDYVAQAAPLWHVFGRLGCFAAGCCYGRPTDAPWGVAFRNPRAMVPVYLLGRSLHPTQLYEALGDLGLAAALYAFVLKKVETGQVPIGSVAAAYFVGYGLLRFFLELFRGDTVPFLGLPATAGQVFCLGLIALGAIISLAARRSPCTPS